MITGNCLCGTVRWQIDGPLGEMTHCHCSMCRKAHAAPFATYVDARENTFQWTAGEGSIVRFESSPDVTRSFCGDCGSVVPDRYGPDTISIPVGCLNEDPGVRPSAHIFVSSKAPWHVIADDLPRFDRHINPANGPALEKSVLPEAKPGVLRGSCLCGDLAYEVRSEIKMVHNCHCSRCRKARAAAHTTNGFTTMEGVIFTKGEEKLVTWKMPEATYFTHVFCKRCGSGMPRLDPGRQIAVIPFGSLDDDPGRGGDDHIFTGSKAPWYDIADDLPQFDAMP